MRTIIATTAATLCCLLSWTDATAQMHGHGAPSTPAEWVERLDKDGDGMVSEDEFDGPAEHFSHFDENGDGYIEESEAPKGPPPRGNRPGGRDDDQMSQGRGHRRPPTGQEFITQQDTDGDGTVSRDEFRGPAHHFDHIDQDGDGTITLEEAPTGPPPRRGHDTNDQHTDGSLS